MKYETGNRKLHFENIYLVCDIFYGFAFKSPFKLCGGVISGRLNLAKQALCGKTSNKYSPIYTWVGVGLSTFPQVLQKTKWQLKTQTLRRSMILWPHAQLEGRRISVYNVSDQSACWWVQKYNVTCFKAQCGHKNSLGQSY